MSKILDDYQSLHSTTEIAKKFNVTIQVVKAHLRSSLGDSEYLRIAHTIGAKRISDRLLIDHVFKKKYSKTMKRSVSHSLRLKMKNLQFRKKWQRKAKKASEKGNKTIKALLSSHEAFRRDWRLKCMRGGKRIVRDQKGIHDPKKQSKRKIWSLQGLKRTGRKIWGPNGERMYNQLELDVANILVKNGLGYQYEKVVDATNTNRFYSLDFIIAKDKVIECTCWTKVDKKAKELSAKFNYLKSHTRFQKFILITQPTLVDRYKRLMPSYVIVQTPEELEHLIAGKRDKIVLTRIIS